MLHVFAEPAALSGETLTITGPDVNHIRNVLRLRPGDPISARVNGVRQEYLCRIESVLPQEVLCRIEEIREDPVRLRRWFTAIWVISYGMLMLGAFIIIAVFALNWL